MEFDINHKTRIVYIKIGFEEFRDLKWLKETLWFELMKRWFKR